MKRMLFMLLLFLSVAILYSQGYSWQWLNLGAGSEELWIYDLARDQFGNTYITGSFQVSAFFGSNSIYCSGDYPVRDLYVAKLDPQGNWLWAIQAGAGSECRANAIAVDEDGNIYLTGSFYDSFSAGSFSLSSVGETDAFFAKADSMGNWQWLFGGGGILGNDVGRDIAIDSIGLIHFTGEFYGSATFHTDNIESNGDSDAFIVTISDTGYWYGVTAVGGTSWDEGFGIAVDTWGNTILTGRYMGTLTLGNDTITAQSSTDIFLAKRNAAGSWIWLKGAGGGGADYGEKVITDDSGNIFLTGAFSSTATFGSNTLYGVGTYDVFVARLDGYGNWIWVTGATGSGEDYVRCIALDAANNVYLGGMFRLYLNFGSTHVGSSGYEDGFLAKLTSDGDWMWAIGIGSDYMDSVYGLAVDAAGSIFTAGFFQEFLYLGDFYLSESNLGIWAGKYGFADTTLPVELSSFTVLNGSGLTATLKWTTESETNLMGFNVLRHTEAELNSAITINAELIMEGTSLGSQTNYTFTDAELIAGCTYFYWLQSLDLNGVCEYFGPVSFIVDIDNPEENPSSPQVTNQLLYPFPNPFNTQLEIPYILKDTAECKLEIYNSKGQLVRKYPTQSKTAGYHQCVWDGKTDRGHSAGSGVYLIKAQINNHLSTRKVLLME